MALCYCFIFCTGDEKIMCIRKGAEYSVEFIKEMWFTYVVLVEFEYGSLSKNIISLWANALKADKLATLKHLLNMVDPDGFV